MNNEATFTYTILRAFRAELKKLKWLEFDNFSATKPAASAWGTPKQRGYKDTSQKTTQPQ